MGIKDRFSQALDALRGKGAPVIQNTTYDSSLGIRGSELYSWMTGGLSSSGVVVSEKSAMSVSAVYACVGLIGGAIAALPFHIYKRTKDGRERYESDLWWLFNESPSPAWTSASAWQFTAQSILLKGDSFWRIVRASRMSPLIVGFEPLHPDSVVVERGDNSRNVYTVTADGVSTAYEQDDILHFTGLGFDGLRSMTPIRYSLRNAAGIAIAADEHASKFFRGGARPDHAIVLPENLKISAEQKEAIRAAWSSQRQSYGEGNTPVLSGGMKIEQLSLNAEDAQLLETRQFGVEEIARAFGVPPHMIGKTDASTSWGSGIEQMSIGFVRYTLRRHIDAIQQEINRKVWPRSNQIFGEFNTDALLDGDSKSQADYFTKALGGPGTQGWMTINEVRKLKNLPPIADGNQIIQSGNNQQANPNHQAMADLERKIEAVDKQKHPVINVNPTINVDNKIPEQSAPVVNVAAPSVEVNVPVPNVTVENNVTSPETIVNVEAIMPEQSLPVVNVAAPTVQNFNNVTPTVEVMLPKRKTETVIERDGNGNITHATQIEEDA